MAYKYVATCCAGVYSSFVFRARNSTIPLVMPAIAAAITAVTGFLNSFDNVRGSRVVLMITEVLLRAPRVFLQAGPDRRKYRDGGTPARRQRVDTFGLRPYGAVRGHDYGRNIHGRLVAVLLVMTAAIREAYWRAAQRGRPWVYGYSVRRRPYFTMAYAFPACWRGFQTWPADIPHQLHNGRRRCECSGHGTMGVRIEVLYECFAAL